jgi:hypothetical protein
MTIIEIYVAVLAVFAILPMILDILLAYLSQNKTRNLLIEKASHNNLTLSELKELLKESGKAPPGIPGLARTMMALTVIVILGIAVFHVLVNGSSGGDSQIINNILSMLAGLLAAITGFYFGGKTAEKKTEEEGTKTSSETPKPSGTTSPG